MKKIILIQAVFIFIFTSCSDVLEQPPLHTPDVTTFWKSESDAQMALNNVYSYLPNQYRYWTECLSDNAIMTNAWGEGGLGEIKQGNLHAAVGNLTAGNFTFWKYDQIRDILYFLDNLQNVPFADENVRKKMEGEARFVLAIKYFYLARAFGDVPLVKEKPLTLDEARNIGKSSRREVFDYIIENLDKSIAYLPNVKDKTGKITRYAALCLKTEVLMWLASLDLFHGQKMSDKGSQQLWREAANTIQGVIQSNEYILETDFVKLFESSTNNLDNETILARQYVENEITNVTNMLGVPGGVSLRGGGWASFSAPRSLVDDYECT
ncbi:MAG: RagB/SusD family nutrient uptake outer membrane protein, partial [Tannerella sp.]|nr:RagB/SusD family nutrient uptake outer membrane protein [Tannerella sp.]